jgi:hypothetical protein
MSTDVRTAERLRDEFSKVRDALRGQNVTAVNDPLGVDGIVEVKMNFFKANGGGEVVLLKDNGKGDLRYTRFRSWGAGGMDFVEKSSYLIKANGSTEFHKKRAEPGDVVAVIESPEGDDDSWIAGLG